MYKEYFSLEKQIKNLGFYTDRKELISLFTDGKKNSLKALSHSEYQQFVQWLKKRFEIKQPWQNDAKNLMRRKVYALFVYKMKFSEERFYAWVVKYGKHHLPLQALNYNQLIDLCTQAEKVYKSFVNGMFPDE